MMSNYALWLWINRSFPWGSWQLMSHYICIAAFGVSAQRGELWWRTVHIWLAYILKKTLRQTLPFPVYEVYAIPKLLRFIGGVGMKPPGCLWSGLWCFSNHANAPLVLAPGGETLGVSPPWRHHTSCFMSLCGSGQPLRQLFRRHGSSTGNDAQVLSVWRIRAVEAFQTEWQISIIS